MFVSFILLVAAMQSGTPFDSIELPESTTQILLVETYSWQGSTGELQRFSKSRRGWIPVGEKVPVVLGRSGLAWGRGLQQETSEGPQKKEGDGKAPSGIFSLGTAFGYPVEPPAGLKLPYRQATAEDFYVDDPNSSEYNRWVRVQPGSSASWKSAEAMKRDDGLYELGIVVKQNESPVIKGRGSAVFLHIWRAPGATTAGCTAMSKENLLTLMRWLDPKQNPLLIQVPRSEFENIKFVVEKHAGGKDE
jgi:D-alanyl-D-alanine dipeptidase